MEAKRQRRAALSTEEVNWLEQHLSTTLNTVEPRTEFVLGLQSRLTSPVTVVLENPTQSSAFLVVGMGLFSGALLIWMLRRLRR